LEDIDSQKTAKWIAAERAFTTAAFAEMPERQAIRSRLVELWNYPRFSLPLELGGRVFFMRNGGPEDEDILCMIEGKGNAPRVVIDPNLPSADGTHAVTGFTPTDDGKLVAYGVSQPGSERSDLRVRNVATGKDLEEVIHSARSTSLSWTKDGGGFFYSQFPDISRVDSPGGELSGERILFHKLGSEQSADRLILETKGQPGESIAARVTDDGRYLIMTATRGSSTLKAVSYVDLVDPAAPRVEGHVVTLFDRYDADFAFVGNKGATFYFLTTLEAPRAKVISVDVTSPGAPAINTVIPEGEDTIDQAVVAGRSIVVASLHDVESRLAMYSAEGVRKGAIALPGTGAVSGISARADDPVLFFRFSSFFVPPVILSYNTETGVESAFEQSKVSIDLTRFDTRRVYCKSVDGTQIPVILTARRDLKLDGSSPTWLHASGGRNVSAKPEFTVPLALWLEMGGIYAQACIRGDDGFGEDWHRAGTKEGKQRAFDDFTAAARFLVSQGYTQTDRLVIEGSIGGGLLVAAVINQHPDLCAVALPDRGVMDMLRYHKLMPGASWREEFGTSEDPAGFKYLLAYSPIHNAVYGGKYPAVLITTGDHDERVSPAHSFKYAAALQAAIRTTPEERPVLIRIGSGPGFGGFDGSFPVARMIDLWADRLGFAAHFLPSGALRLPTPAAP
jgi:prolyl oligopeptidase